MRSFALAGIVVVLSGCSLPYADTSFKAMPKPEHMAEGEHHEVNDRGPTEAVQGAAPESATANVSTTDADPVPTRTGTVFPTTAQPAGG